MSNFSIGISGLNAAQSGLDIIGNNIANAATDGYHRQKVELSPAYSSQDGGVLFGGGVVVKRVTRIIDDLLEKEIYRQQSQLGQVSQESTTLYSIENAFGELSADDAGLNSSIDKFFNSLQDLTAHPGEIIWQNQTMSDAQSMAGQFRTLGNFLANLETQIRLEAENSADSINNLANQIAQLNDQIERLEISGKQANNLRDQRDQYISDLSEIVGIQTQNRGNGVVDVSIEGIPLVMKKAVNEIKVRLDESGQLAVAIKGTSNYTTNISGGRLGGLLELKNTIIKDIHTDLDSLASAIIEQINQYHVQGVGSQGSFSQLSSWTMTNTNLADFNQTVTDGKLYIRITNTSTGAITRGEIDIDVSTDTLSTVAAKISAVTGVSASVGASQLTISADANYKFDFLPAVLPDPKSLNLNGASPPAVAVSGIYSGTANETFTCTVTGTDEVGNGTLQLTVKDGSNNTIATANIGTGYAAGDKIDIGNGLMITLSTGDLVDADSFQIDAYSSTDTSGFLKAAGINTFFSGVNASDMAVESDIVSNPKQIATALGAEMTDNTNALKMAAVKDLAVSSLNSLTCRDFYRKLVTDVGQNLSIKLMRQENLGAMAQNLATQKAKISGVDINEEATQLLVFERMFQAMAKYMNVIQTSTDSLMSLVI
jgi:flagellar hook-associated protein 1 FlgK